MKKVQEGSYLGDILSADGSIDRNIEARRQKGIYVARLLESWLLLFQDIFQLEGLNVTKWNSNQC